VEEERNRRESSRRKAAAHPTVVGHSAEPIACVFRSKPIEFDKGRAATAVSSLDKLPSVIDTLIAAARNGKLDEQLAHATAQVKTSMSKGKRTA
jgi:hypothetical protein